MSRLRVAVAGLSRAADRLLLPDRAAQRRRRVARFERRRAPTPEAPSTGGSAAWRGFGNVVALATGAHRKQMRAHADGRFEVKTGAERRVDAALALSVVNVGFVGLSLAWAPAIWLTLPIMVLTAVPMYELAWRAAVDERRISAWAADAALFTVAVVTGHFALVSGTSWLNVLAVKIRYMSQQSAKANLRDLFGDQPQHVWVPLAGPDGREVDHRVPLAEVRAGDRVVVRAGQIIPVDGTVERGEALVDQRRLTGESQPAERGPGDRVLASTVVLAGHLYVTVDQAGPETVAMQIGRILERTAEYKDARLTEAERVADLSVPVTAGLFAVTLPFLGIGRAVGLLANKFGNKMKDFGPANMLVSLNVACVDGILVKDGQSFDRLGGVDTVVFDKTGTLTVDAPTVHRVHAFGDTPARDVLELAATAELGQSHPIARAIVGEARARGIEPAAIGEAAYTVGFGIRARVGGRTVRVGSPRFAAREGLRSPPALDALAGRCARQGRSVVCVGVDDAVVGAIELRATARPEARAVVQALREMGLSMHIISGDREGPTRAMAEALGIERYSAEVLPEDKAAIVARLEAEGRSVCFVGDGINDALALDHATVSVSLAGASRAAADTAQVLLMDATLRHLPRLFAIARGYRSSMRASFALSTVPTGVGLTGVLFLGWGLVGAVMLSNAVLLVGIGYTLRPLVQPPRFDLPAPDAAGSDAAAQRRWRPARTRRLSGAGGRGPARRSG